MNFLKSPKSPDDAADDKLLQEYRQHGDLAVLAALYGRYMHLVYGVCLTYLKDEEQSKDAVMQIFEELITKISRHDVKQFKSWLYVLSRNFCLMKLRSDKKFMTEKLDDHMEFADDMHPYSEMEENITALER